MWVMRMAQSAEDGSMPMIAACFDPSTENGSFWAPTKFFECKGPAGKIEFDKDSQNEESKKLLWELSEEACGKLTV